jgi:hypothetical protein
MRNLNQNARAVSRFRIAPASPAMREIDENLNALDDDVVRLLTLDARHETDSAGVVLELGVVKSLGGR